MRGCIPHRSGVGTYDKRAYVKNIKSNHLGVHQVIIFPRSLVITPLAKKYAAQQRYVTGMYELEEAPCRLGADARSCRVS